MKSACSFLAVFALALFSAQAGVTAYTYDPASRLVSADYGANRTISYAYDNAGNLIQSSQPSPGLVVGPVVGNQFTVSWPAAPGGFGLYKANAIGAGAQWSNVGVTPTQVGNFNFVTVNLSLVGNTFYRLQK